MKITAIGLLSTMGILFAATHLIACANFSSSLVVLPSACSTQLTGQSTQVFADPVTSATFLTFGAADASLISALNANVGQNFVQGALSFGSQIQCTNVGGPNQPSCVFFLFDSAMSTGITPANLEVRMHATANSKVIVRAESSGSAISFGFANGGNSVQLAVVIAGSAPKVITCASGSDSTSQCPSAIYGTTGTYDLIVSGCSPQIQITASVNDIAIPKLSTVVAGPNSGRVGFLANSKSDSPSAEFDSVAIVNLH